jgi:hypothetical protein
MGRGVRYRRPSRVPDISAWADRELLIQASDIAEASAGAITADEVRERMKRRVRNAGLRLPEALRAVRQARQRRDRAREMT